MARTLPSPRLPSFIGERSTCTLTKLEPFCQMLIILERALNQLSDKRCKGQSGIKCGKRGKGSLDSKGSHSETAFVAIYALREPVIYVLAEFVR